MDIQWEFVHGLFDQAVYGGRVDNPIDSDVLKVYLKQYFTNSYFNGTGKGPKLKFGPGITLPNSCELKDFKELCESISDSDTPRFFGLPLNIDRSCQKVISDQIVAQLKVLARSSNQIGSKFDKDEIRKQFKPIWKLWESLKKVKQINELRSKRENNLFDYFFF